MIKKFGLLQETPDMYKMIKFSDGDIGFLYEYLNEVEKTKIIPKLKEIKIYYPAL
tara:strand:- start:10623 stop:10787 length:165 start_codon:yes stop_codon:yes gene_type:complete